MVRPIDMQDNFSKTKGAERVNQIQKSAPELDQQHTAQVTQEQQARKQRETRPTERTDEAVIHREKQKDSQDQKKKKKKGEDKEEKQRGLNLTA